MTFRVVTIYDEQEGWSRVAVVKTLEDDPTMWGVVSYYANPWEARRGMTGMQEQRENLECLGLGLHHKDRV